ncbi:MAG: lycopene cyclase family protein, partial [Bacteroidota bacterium]
MEHYDYIICGAGLAGLSLAMRLSEPEYSHLKVLVVDRDRKKTNDRTWSFWIRPEEQRFPELYLKTWDRLAFYGDRVDRTFDISPFQYHTIRGIDFYNHALAKIDEVDHISFAHGDVRQVQNHGDVVHVQLGDQKVSCRYAIDSIVRSFPEDNKLFVWQHFMGWEVESDVDHFDDEVATYMD